MSRTYRHRHVGRTADSRHRWVDSRMNHRFDEEAAELYRDLAHDVCGLPCVAAARRHFHWLKPHYSCLAEGLGYHPAHDLFENAWNDRYGHLPKWAVCHGKVGCFVWVGSDARQDLKRESHGSARAHNRTVLRRLKANPAASDDEDFEWWGPRHGGDVWSLY